MKIKFPKPERRTAKPKQRIARSGRPRKARKTSRAKLGRLADKLFSLIVRKQGACRFHMIPRAGWPTPEQNGACAGALQTAHVFSRRYRSVRWDEDNAMPLCAGAHVMFTHDPIGWEEFVIGVMGEPQYRDLRTRAQAKWDGDLEGTLVRLKERAAVLGIEL